MPHESNAADPGDRRPYYYSDLSTAAIPPSCFWTGDLLLAASAVIIQPATAKIVVVHDTQSDTWFLPRGRKDIGESLEQCALREAYEESGYRAEFLPLFLPTRAPAPPANPRARTAPIAGEPAFVTTTQFGPYGADPGGQYLTFYYAAQIPADAVRARGTGMPDEQHYVGTLLARDDALCRLPRGEAHVAEVVYRVWELTVQQLAREAQARGRGV
ncbi:hypothetical protein BC834DRAFT_890168 [Gloeopeniophorella convolvens]|nr:hypothetical protein BC834DRAFT_890168 [Gloeopeniophorella convolvens]